MHQLSHELQLKKPSRPLSFLPMDKRVLPACETAVVWDGVNMTLNRTTEHFIHPEVIVNLRKLLQFITPTAFEADLFSADNGMCHTSRAVIEHSRSPIELVKNSLLLPIHQNQVAYWQQASLKIPRGLRFRRRSPCIWRGSKTGYAQLQHLYNHNRTLCNRWETDRECVLRVIPQELANVRFGSDRSYTSHDCVLCIDGNTWASSFKTALYNGQLAVRVGGVHKHMRLSSYEWFEPYLNHGTHYIQTTIDNLASTLKVLNHTELEVLHQIALNGQKAFIALTNKTSIACHVRHEIMRTTRQW